MKIWLKKEYQLFLNKLEKLTRNQLAYLAKKTGVIFDEPQKVTKEEYLLVLDETNPNLLKKEYQNIIKNNKITTKKYKNHSDISDIEKTDISPVNPGYGNNPINIDIKLKRKS